MLKRKRPEQADEEHLSYADYGREVIEAYNGIRALRHDMRGHLDVIDALAGAGRLDELRDYISGLRGEALALAAMTSLTGNAAVDALISVKAQEAREMGAEFKAQAVLPYSTPLSATEWTGLLGNMLTNAITACSEVAGAGGAAYIDLNISFAHGMLYIELENSSAGRYARRGGEFLSTKQSGGGVGAKRIDAIVARHGGYVERDARPDSFRTRAIIPLKGE